MVAKTLIIKGICEKIKRWVVREDWRAHINFSQFSNFVFNPLISSPIFPPFLLPFPNGSTHFFKILLNLPSKPFSHSFPTTYPPFPQKPHRTKINYILHQIFFLYLTQENLYIRTPKFFPTPPQISILVLRIFEQPQLSHNLPQHFPI